jgi:hypothetical protein
MAAELGYSKPNMISMIKFGQTRVPLNKIVQFAKTLGVDPVHFLRIVMMEYHPQTWEVIEEVIGGHLISENETKILDIIRSTAQGIDIAPENDEEELELMTLIAKWRDKKMSIAEAALKKE